jgi:hypothetical protein
MKNLQTFLLTELAAPLTRRLGTALGAYLVAQGIGSDPAEQIVTGVLAAIAVGIDLAMSYLNRSAR